MAQTALHEIDYAATVDFREPSAEISSTLADLCAAFGRQPVAAACIDAGLLHHQISTIEKLDMLRFYTIFLLQSRRPRMVAQIVSKLVGMQDRLCDETDLEQIARHHGLTKQAVSKEVASIADHLGIPHLVPPAIRNSHRLMNRRNFTSHESAVNHIAGRQPARSPVHAQLARLCRAARG